MAGRVMFAGGCSRQAKRWRAPRCPRIVAVLLLLQALAAALLFPQPAAADAVKGSISAAVENGFARLIFTLGNEVESQVRVANNIVVISFDRPVDVNVDHIRDGAGDYIGAARRDPDGKAVRLALTRRVTMNSMVAGDRLYVDLLPDTWKGLPPGLPREVIEELARRARDAEKKLRQEHLADADRKVPLIRVRIASQPTFTRYMFQLPEPTSVAADDRKDKLTLTFNGMLNFDLADAKAALPATLQSIDSELDQDTAVVRFVYSGPGGCSHVPRGQQLRGRYRLGRDQGRQAAGYEAGRQAGGARCGFDGQDDRSAGGRGAAADRAGEGCGRCRGTQAGSGAGSSARGAS